VLPFKSCIDLVACDEIDISVNAFFDVLALGNELGGLIDCCSVKGHLQRDIGIVS